MSKLYDPMNWYWQATDGRLYSSARQAIVPADDTAFADWSADGTAATPWPKDASGQESDAEMAAVLAPYGLWLNLTDYAAAKRYEVETGGIKVGDAAIATDRESQALINGAFNLAQAKLSSTFKFKVGSGFVDMDASAIQGIAIAVGEHVQACFAKEAEVVGAITAKKPTITTREQVDAAFASLG